MSAYIDVEPELYMPVVCLHSYKTLNEFIFDGCIGGHYFTIISDITGHTREFNLSIKDGNMDIRTIVFPSFSDAIEAVIETYLIKRLIFSY